MSIAIDPSEMRVPASAPVKTGASSRGGRLAILTVLGGVGLVGLSAGAYSMLSGLAAPAPTGVRIGRVSTDWPDLRDGVPALVSTAGRADPVPSGTSEPISIKTVAQPERSPEPEPIAAKAPEPRPVEPLKIATVSPPARPARLPVIENAATVPPAPVVPLVEKARPAPLVAPTARETTRARTAPDNAFAALPPASSATPAIPPKSKPAAVARAKPTVKPAATNAETAKVATAQPSQAAEPDSDETEVFGMKVPSLAPVGRKFAEGVEAIGNAVKRFPEQF